ncbi:MAG: hypothetical protein NT167_01625, partial [Verrucomicrobia bacterium]|nr:hypothetical protein [Verrucomicrobiota bacterium]
MGSAGARLAALEDHPLASGQELLHALLALRQGFDLGKQLRPFDVLLLELRCCLLGHPLQEVFVFVAFEQLFQVGVPLLLLQLAAFDAGFKAVRNEKVAHYGTDGNPLGHSPQVYLPGRHWKRPNKTVNRFNSNVRKRQCGFLDRGGGDLHGFLRYLEPRHDPGRVLLLLLNLIYLVPFVFVATVIRHPAVHL